MSLPLGFLALGSIFVGYLFRDAILGLGTPFFGNSIFILPSNSDSMIDAEFIDTLYK
jgi:NADH-ubiquinone oxidoreductase chain 5